MSTTTTATATETRTHYTVQGVLSDYDLHHSQDSDAASNAQPEPANAPQNPSSWPTAYRRVPAYRPVNPDLDPSERRVYPSRVDQAFVVVMMTGVFLQSVSLEQKEAAWALRADCSLGFVKGVAKLNGPPVGSTLQDWRRVVRCSRAGFFLLLGFRRLRSIQCIPLLFQSYPTCIPLLFHFYVSSPSPMQRGGGCGCGCGCANLPGMQEIQFKVCPCSATPATPCPKHYSASNTITMSWPFLFRLGLASTLDMHTTPTLLTWRYSLASGLSSLRVLCNSRNTSASF